MCSARPCSQWIGPFNSADLCPPLQFFFFLFFSFSVRFSKLCKYIGRPACFRYIRLSQHIILNIYCRCRRAPFEIHRKCIPRGQSLQLRLLASTVITPPGQATGQLQSLLAISWYPLKGKCVNALMFASSAAVVL